MASEFETKRMLEGRLFNPYKVGDNAWDRVHSAQKKFNESEFWEAFLCEYGAYDFR